MGTSLKADSPLLYVKAIMTTSFEEGLLGRSFQVRDCLNPSPFRRETRYGKTPFCLYLLPLCSVFILEDI